MGKVSSRHGIRTRRTPAEYRGDHELVKMKGIPDLFPYHRGALGSPPLRDLAIKPAGSG